MELAIVQRPREGDSREPTATKLGGGGCECWAAECFCALRLRYGGVSKSHGSMGSWRESGLVHFAWHDGVAHARDSLAATPGQSAVAMLCAHSDRGDLHRPPGESAHSHNRKRDTGRHSTCASDGRRRSPSRAAAETEIAQEQNRQTERTDRQTELTRRKRIGKTGDNWIGED